MKQEILDKLIAVVGDDRVTCDETELLVYECDALALFKHQPDVVVFPTTTSEVADIVRVANEHQIPFLARGAGTGLSGGATAVEGGIIIEMQKMNRVVSIDPENRFAILQPGVVNLDVSRAVSSYGLYYAPDPSSQMACSIGGNVAENAGGPHCLKYGMTTNHTLELEAVLATGKIVRIGNPAGEPVGYDLVGLVVGSEGTFAIVTEITVRLLRKPNAVKTLLAAFHSVESCSQTVSAVIAEGIVPAALEFVDQKTTEAVEASVYRAGYRLDAAASLLIEVDGFGVAVEETVQSIVSIAERNGSYDIRVAENEEERARLWMGRKGAFGAMGRISPDMIVMDAVIPRTQLPGVLTRIQSISDNYDLPVANVFHAGDGNLHPLILFDNRRPDHVERVFRMAEEIMEVCVNVGGALSGEHGIGLEKKEYMRMVYSEDDLDVMQRTKGVFNPSGLLNPGKIFPAGRACTEVGPGVTSTAEAARRIDQYVRGVHGSES
jgi:glycolate oxidase subunit GlcD